MKTFAVTLKRIIVQRYVAVVEAVNDLDASDEAQRRADNGEIDFNAGSSEQTDPEMEDVSELSKTT